MHPISLTQAIKARQRGNRHPALFPISWTCVRQDPENDDRTATMEKDSS